MKTKKLLTLVLIVLAAINIKAQTISCSSLCITDIQMDSITPNTMNVTVLFTDSNSTHINYPYISVITDPNGDTIATGNMNFFIHGSNSSQTYSLTTTLTSIPTNFYCTVYFNYDTSVCTLSYPCFNNGTIPCSYFCATDMQIDSAGYMDINISMSGSNALFISYPFISAITNTNGDTIATGVLSSFGQFGNTNQVYQVNTSLTSIPTNFSCFIHFSYISTECILSYPCTALKINEEQIMAKKMHVFPNPISVSEMLHIRTAESLQNSIIQVVNSMGQTVLYQKLASIDNDFVINLSDRNFIPGMYYLILETKKGKDTTKFIIR